MFTYVFFCLIHSHKAHFSLCVTILLIVFFLVSYIVKVLYSVLYGNNKYNNIIKINHVKYM